MKAAEFKKNEQNTFDVIDTRNSMILKRNVKSIRKAAAYVNYYNEEIQKAEAAWEG